MIDVKLFYCCLY